VSKYLNGIAAIWLLCLSAVGLGQSKSELEACTRIIQKMCGPVAPRSDYVQINANAQNGTVVEDIDRGWVRNKSGDFCTILNDRLLIRSYSTLARNDAPPPFAVVVKEDVPLSKANHAMSVENRLAYAKQLVTSNSVLEHDLSRYPIFRAETSRLTHILIRSMTHPDDLEALVGYASDVDFDLAHSFRINGCSSHEPKGSWERNAKCTLANCFLTQVFAKVSDSKRVSIDECIEFTNKLLELVEAQSIPCDRLTELKDASKSILAWKREKVAVENRLKYFPTPRDKALEFLMTRGNVPVGRATYIEDEDYVDLRRMWSEEVYVEACKSLVDCEIPSRFVVANRAEGPVILSVRQVLMEFGPKEVNRPNRTDRSNDK
jgi:hypothetical protein